MRAKVRYDVKSKRVKRRNMTNERTKLNSIHTSIKHHKKEYYDYGDGEAKLGESISAFIFLRGDCLGVLRRLRAGVLRAA